MREILLERHGAIRYEMYISQWNIDGEIDNNGNLFHFDVYYMFINTKKYDNIVWSGNSLFLMFTNMNSATY